jgi:PAS domain S-box-containing protein
VSDRGLRDAVRHLGAALPHGRTLPERQWQVRHRALLWLLWAHVAVIPIVSLLYDEGPGQGALDFATVGFLAVVAQLKLGGRRAQSLAVTIGLLSCSALLVHISDGRSEAYFHFFVMVAALSLYEDWVPFGAAVAYVLIQQGITAAIVDYDRAESPWLWALVHSAFIGALSVVCLATWRASEHDREAFRSLVESLEEGVLMVDDGGQLVAANPSAARILGMDPARVLAVNASDPAWSFVADDGVPIPDHTRPLRVTAKTGKPQIGVPLRLRRPDGSTRWLSVSTRAIEPEREGPHTVVVSFSDVTDERNSADALARSNAELAQFAYVASHDLSEPLRVVASYLQLLRRRYHGRLDPDADEFSDAPQQVELGSVTADVLRSLAAALVDASAEIEIGELPAVLGDRAQLEQLLQNLVANALKFRLEGGAQVWVHSEECASGMAQIAVADGGIGIAPEQREHVFEMFQRVHEREVYEGTGIGLAICRKIVERHGGRIWIDEREGGGAVFRFTLPVA